MNHLEVEETPENITFFEYRKYVSKIIMSLEGVLYDLIYNHEHLGLDILINDKNFNFDNLDHNNANQVLLYNYITRFFIDYINRLNSKKYNSCDKEYFDKDISNIYIIEDLINLSYPLIVREDLCIDTKESYLYDINEQLEYIIEQNKSSVIDKI